MIDVSEWARELRLLADESSEKLRDVAGIFQGLDMDEESFIRCCRAKWNEVKDD